MPQRQSFNAYWQWHAFIFVLKIAACEVRDTCDVFSRCLLTIFSLSLSHSHIQTHIFAVVAIAVLIAFLSYFPLLCHFSFLWFYCVIFLWLYMIFLTRYEREREREILCIQFSFFPLFREFLLLLKKARRIDTVIVSRSEISYSLSLPIMLIDIFMNGIFICPSARIQYDKKKIKIKSHKSTCTHTGRERESERTNNKK